MGYLTLPAEWLKYNPKFQLTIPLKHRYVSPHPYTNQDVVALARGPLIYCVEDADNSWVDDHFKSLLFDSSANVTESSATIGEEEYIQMTAHDAAFFLVLNGENGPFSPTADVEKKDGAKELHFVPYCLRDNRGGKGHMRVGLRRKH